MPADLLAFLSGAQRRANPPTGNVVTLRLVEDPPPDPNQEDYRVATVFAYDALEREIGRVSLGVLDSLSGEACHAAWRAIAARHAVRPRTKPLTIIEVHAERGWRDRGLGIELYATAAWYAAAVHGQPIVGHACAGDKTSPSAQGVWQSAQFQRLVDVEGLVGYWRGGAALGPERSITLGPARSRGSVAPRYVSTT